MTTVLLLGVFLALLACSAFFSSAETAYFSVDPIQLRRIGGLFGLTEVAGADIYFGAKVRIRGKADGKGAHAPSPST